MPIELSLLGAPTVSIDGQVHSLEFERRGQLLVYLALKRAWVGRAELAALLWPEQESKLAHTNLRKAIFRLQSSPLAQLLEIDGAALRCPADSDVIAFGAAVREDRSAEAVALYRGPLLQGFDNPRNDGWSDWLRFERERLRSAWRAAAQRLLGGDMDQGRAIDLATRLLADDPLDEAALQSLVRWLVVMGQPARARQACDQFIARVESELGLEPGAELRVLRASLAAPGQAAPAIAGTAVRSPVASEDGFVGRSVELRRIGELMAQPDCRLLCITGPGGMGKTRLARRALAQLAGSHVDGAAIVSLEDLTSASQIGGRLARELGLEVRSRVDPMQTVLEALRGRDMLLTLDNFEQLATDARVLEPLLAQCPRLKLIVTSRVRLALAGEWLLPLDGLPWPDEEDRDHLESFDAARLFINAARKVRPDFEPQAEAGAIVDICRQVEGLPLALELAASWTRVLSCRQIAEELAGGTELLRAIDPARQARHGSIEQVFDGSWRLLSAVEREALARLSVFRGGFTAEAARAVAQAPLPVLGALADKSLLRRDPARLNLHPLVHQLAAARLGEGTASEQAARAAHAGYFLRWLEHASGGIDRGDESALASADREFENCRQAWLWAVGQQRFDLLLGVSAALLSYCDNRARIQDGVALFGVAVDSPLAQSDARFHALLMSQLAHLLYRLDRYDDAIERAGRALQSADESDSGTLWQAHNVLATCAYRRGHYPDARRHFLAVLEHAPPERRASTRASTLDHLALIEKANGNYDEALKLSLQALAQYRQLENYTGLALCLNNLGSLYLSRRDAAAAEVPLREGLAACERHGLTSTMAFIHANLAEVSELAGRLDDSDAHVSRALEIASSVGNQAIRSTMYFQRARLALRRADLESARVALSQGVSVAMTLQVPLLHFAGIQTFAELLRAQGEATCAGSVLRYAIAHPSASTQARNELGELLAQLPQDAAPEPAWPGIELDDLLRRIVAEAHIGYAPLIGRLTAGP